jgi:Tol biopolymer transport system component
MGEVYRARDTRLDRSVAIKLLPAEFAQNAQMKIRFEREAKTISSLSHPNICQLYDVGQVDGTDYLVMEFLEGETLAERLTKGSLPLHQALKVGIEIASALEKAHRLGVVHRDLKPSNIMLTKSGAKLLDFGLAKGQHAAVGVRTNIATEKQLTAEGTILGTFQYMAPEQLEGSEADARADIWALGAVLYEMTSGQKAFNGKSKTSLIAAIVDRDPQPLTQIQPMTPPAFERVVRTCLAKDPDERWQTAHDVLLELKWIEEEGGAPRATPARASRRARVRELVAWVGFAAALAAALFVASRERPQPPHSIRFSIAPPENATFNAVGRDAGPVAVSPDGSHVAFVATDAGGKKLIWLRALKSVVATPLPGTEGASYPFWSPDAGLLGFFADGKLKKIPATGGAVQTICDAPLARGGTWNRDGTILFTPATFDPLYRVSAAGGTPVATTRLERSAQEQMSHRWPYFLPDGRHFLYLSFRSIVSAEVAPHEVYVGSLDSPDRKLLLRANSKVEYAPPGYLVYLHERNLMALPFDADTLRIIGEPFAIAEQAHSYPNTASGVFSASEKLLAYQSGGTPVVSQVLWFSRKGEPIGETGPPADYEDPRLSRDGARVALTLKDARTGQKNIYVHETATAVTTRFTFAASFEHFPVWSPDASRIVFATNRNGPADLYQKNVTGSVEEEPLFRSPHEKSPTDWSSDGRFIVYQELDPKTKWDLWLLPLFGDRKPLPLLRGASNEMSGQLSPDRRFIAYTSDESGRWEVYVAPVDLAQELFRGDAPQRGKWQISTAGGSQPRWRTDGKELFYLGADNTLMAAPIREGAVVGGAPLPLFRTKPITVGGAYDVSTDGQKFLINTAVGSSTPITIAVNWHGEVKRR